MKVLIFLFLVQFWSCRVWNQNPHKAKTRRLAEKMGRKLYLEDLTLNFANYPLDQMDTTNTNTYQMEGHNRRSSQMRQIGSWFGDVDMSIDDFRDAISRKLDQLNMSLQKPKLPFMGMYNGAIQPGLSFSQSMPQGSNQQGFNPSMAAGTQMSFMPSTNNRGGISNRKEPGSSQNSQQADD